MSGSVFVLILNECQGVVGYSAVVINYFCYFLMYKSILQVIFKGRPTGHFCGKFGLSLKVKSAVSLDKISAKNLVTLEN